MVVSDHFSGKFEVEFKYRLKSISQFLVILKSMPHKIMFQDNME